MITYPVICEIIAKHKINIQFRFTNDIRFKVANTRSNRLLFKKVF